MVGVSPPWLPPKERRRLGHAASFEVAGGPEGIVVPKSVLELMVRVLGSLSAGEGITVVPAHAELTTQQAADILKVSPRET